MADSWGHKLVKLTDEEQRNHTRLGGKCTGKCQEPATHSATYKFVTGRSGRVGERTIYKCTPHAEAFAAKHGLTVGPVAS
jgi:hypothetical protein